MLTSDIRCVIDANADASRNPTAVMMIGLPGSGKSSIVKAIVRTFPGRFAVISSDDYIERRAAKAGLTYRDVFGRYVAAANHQAFDDARAAVTRGQDLIWDQTNLTRKTRAQKIEIIQSSPVRYDILACLVARPDDEEWHRRLCSRRGKMIPWSVLQEMTKTLEPPAMMEGFSRIVVLPCA